MFTSRYSQKLKQVLASYSGLDSNYGSYISYCGFQS